jgi:hypothetical protein
LPFVDGFKVELLDLVAVYHHNAGFFRVRGIDKHFLCHVSNSHMPFGAATPVGRRVA